jgi:hypothetical protein|tara:strand:+ start:128 stop:361 length:234 start_codon:yes stop_codon:yes gene_type:complete
MLLYTEAQLNTAYRIDCKTRTRINEPWITLEEFRPMYEELVEYFMQAYEEDKVLLSDIPEAFVDSINDLLDINLTLE